MTSRIGKSRFPEILSGPRGFRPGSRAGFTMIEISLVVVILMVVVGMASPAFKKTFSELALKDSVFHVVQLMRYAQERALSERTSFEVKFDAENSRFQLLSWDDKLDPPGFARAPGKAGRSRELPSGISLQSDPEQMIFYRDGRTDEIALELFDRYGSAYHIKTKDMFGHFEIEPGEHSPA